MSIILDENTRVIVQGITGNEASYWTAHMVASGTKVVAGVTPGKEGQKMNGIPVFHSVRNAVKEFDVDMSLICVPPRFAKDAVLEALDSGIKDIVNIADGIPIHDQMEIRTNAIRTGAKVIGGNTTGLITPGKAMVGMIPYWIERVYKPGNIGLITRSGSLANEITSLIVRAGFGMSTWIGIGGDAIPSMRLCEYLPLFEKDKNTDALMLIGEVGGTMEEEVAEYINAGNFSKPVIVFFGGVTAPEGKAMGHGGAIIQNGMGRIDNKIKMLSKAGAYIAKKPSDAAVLVHKALN